MTERTPCKGTNNRGKSCGAHVPEGGEYCRWHSTDQRQAANAGARTSASAGAPDGSDGKRAVWQQLIAFAREHPAMASALVYFPLCFMGVFYEYHLLRSFGVDLFQFIDVKEFLLPGLRQPLALIWFALLIVGVVLVIVACWFWRWLAHSLADFLAPEREPDAAPSGGLSRGERALLWSKRATLRFVDGLTHPGLQSAAFAVLAFAAGAWVMVWVAKEDYEYIRASAGKENSQTTGRWLPEAVSRVFPLLNLATKDPDECLELVRLVSSTKSHVLIYEETSNGTARAIREPAITRIEVLGTRDATPDGDGSYAHIVDEDGSPTACPKDAENDEILAHVTELSTKLASLTEAVLERPINVTIERDVDLRVAQARLERTAAWLERLSVGGTRESCLPDGTYCASVFFRHGRDTLAGAELAQLRALRGIIELAREHGCTILIEGFADESGPDGGNLDLSGRRADFVKQWLIDAELGLGKADFKAIGWGERFHLPTHSGKRPEDRRVDVTACAQVPRLPTVHVTPASSHSASSGAEQSPASEARVEQLHGPLPG